MTASLPHATSRFFLRFSAYVAVIGMALSSSVFALSSDTPPLTEVPDGSPQLAQEKIISNTSTGVTGASNLGRSASTTVVSEERIQGRLASASVSIGGAKGYTVIDPNAGRTDRDAANGGKRLSPSIWEVFRF